jgi:hypothetical protein
VTAALPRLVATFADAPHVTVAGFSAGGIGASVNYHQIAEAFGHVRTGPIPLIVDSGPLLREPYLSASAQSTLRESWGLDQTVGPWCPSCTTLGANDIYAAAAQLHPGVRSSLVCAYSDQTVRLIYAALLSPVELGALESGLRDLSAWRGSVDPGVAPSALRELFYVSDRHGAIEYEPLSATPGLADFLAAQLDGSATWASVVP